MIRELDIVTKHGAPWAEGGAGVGRGAVLSTDERYRYVLSRVWGPDPRTVCFVGLNPSTADHEDDDPTVRRCMGFARAWGYDSLLLVNLFAYRATDPRAMAAADDPIGPENDGYVESASLGSRLTVACWGAHDLARERAAKVLPHLMNLHHLGLTQGGHPKHPLYLASTTKLIPWKADL